ncbi:MAG: serine protease [Gammaproteobacteria bacterium]|nr:serine protease [Gammaproteobacteria bacterium]
MRILIQTVITVLSLSAFMVSSATANPPKARILYGESASAGQWPGLAGLVTRGSDGASVECGAVLISPRHLATAAHCVYVGGVLREPGDFQVRLNEHDLTLASDHIAMPVRRVTLHPFYNSTNMANDLAILELAQQVTDVTPAFVASEPVDQEQAYAVGWGLTENNRTVNTPQEVALTLHDVESCQSNFDLDDDAIGSKMICAGDYGKQTDTCNGDSGGPLYVRRGNRQQVVGITSWGYECGDRITPGVYTNLSEYSDWLLAEINRPDGEYFSAVATQGSLRHRVVNVFDRDFALSIASNQNGLVSSCGSILLAGQSCEIQVPLSAGGDTSLSITLDQQTNDYPITLKGLKPSATLSGWYDTDAAQFVVDGANVESPTLEQCEFAVLSRSVVGNGVLVHETYPTSLGVMVNNMPLFPYQRPSYRQRLGYDVGILGGDQLTLFASAKYRQSAATGAFTSPTNLIEPKPTKAIAESGVEYASFGLTEVNGSSPSFDVSPRDNGQIMLLVTTAGRLQFSVGTQADYSVFHNGGGILSDNDRFSVNVQPRDIVRIELENPFEVTARAAVLSTYLASSAAYADSVELSDGVFTAPARLFGCIDQEVWRETTTAVDHNTDSSSDTESVYDSATKPSANEEDQSDVGSSSKKSFIGSVGWPLLVFTLLFKMLAQKGRRRL